MTSIMNPFSASQDEINAVFDELRKSAVRQIRNDGDDYIVVDKVTGRVLSRHASYREARKAA